MKLPELILQLQLSFEDYNQAAKKQDLDAYYVEDLNGMATVHSSRSKLYFEIPHDLPRLMTHLKKNAQNNECTMGTLADLEKIEKKLVAGQSRS
ncbi:hypothetical protein ACFQ22_11770 [Lentilactobacillus raoultii]|uniref:Uncharacterized protein n=1 Tax=Lentilactobacillus raoultii TaxID=1987503 RepID=A0ABW3PLV5_9LACO|nr:hypothetical protein [Lentilactobacillus raoultii]